ncbi:class I SAM-dependent methyltransferase [Arthrobacter sp. zg-Y877]|uniref:class I SAM-dependent methyltransferase n=1 Tax=Arthrobacter sp. zg-Y877 TaxID=3049074 RepID=UPI0025A372DB|nr:class I SAM-dependent methyltransferase [Arthrobacter sp. zg-Y877]MDM7990237.1 class I SAM-dependent methyltransferase [Arthrobacter sp. zg-Y877]
MESPNPASPDSAHPADHSGTPQPPLRDPAAVEAHWDERYAGSDGLWSGQPNPVLVSEASGLAPARALDVGCGEGADALWLAQQGWDVTALDVSGIALSRAARQAERISVEVTWLHSGLVEAALPPASFELVSAQYPVLPRTEQNIAEQALLQAVAPGGVLLLVHHALPAAHGAQDHGVDLSEYVLPGDVAALLDDGWQVEVDEIRPRHVSAGAGTHHKEDVVLRARRLH